MIDAFVTLFTGADFIFYILFVLAIVLLVVEAILPSFGIVGLCGILSAFGAIVERCVTGDNSTTQIVSYILYVCLFMLVAVLIVKGVQKLVNFRKNKKKFAVVDGVKVPLTSEGNLDYSFLLGKEGVVVSDLKPAGKAKIDGQVYNVTTTKEYIYEGTIVKVDKVMNQKVVVKRKG